MIPFFRLRLLPVFCAVTASLIGCDCQTHKGIDQSRAELGIVWTDSSDTEYVNRDATYRSLSQRDKRER